MAKNYAYIRISDAHKQDASSQRKSIANYATKHGLAIDSWTHVELSGSRTSKAERGLIDLISKLKSGDRLLVNDIERLGRDSISDIIEVITRIINAGCELHLCLAGEVITPDHKNDISVFFTAVGRAFAAQDFAKQRSLKAKAAATRRKRQGLPTGRAPGAIIKSKLDPFEAQIVFWLNQEVAKNTIAERCNVSPATLQKWLNRRDELRCNAIELGVFTPGMSISEIKEVLKQHNGNM